MAGRLVLLTLAAMLASAGASLAQTQASDEPVARARADVAPPVVAGSPSTSSPAASMPSALPPVAQSSPSQPSPSQSSTGTTATPASGDPTGDQIAAWLRADAQPVQPLDGQDDPDAPPRPRRIHGEVGVTVSSRGYSGYAAAAMPIGQASELDVAVGAAHVRTPWGRTANPKSISVGLYLDGSDIGRMLSRDKCSAPRWGVSLPGDPQVNPDGTCVTTAPVARSDAGR